MLPSLHCLNTDAIVQYPTYEGDEDGDQADSALEQFKETVRNLEIDPHVEKTCPICLIPFNEQQVFVPHCGHAVCMDCARRSYKPQPDNAPKCAVCRLDLNEAEMLEVGWTQQQVDELTQINLISASRRGLVDDVRNLLADGADVEMEDDDGMTPLMHAAYNGHVEVLKLLLEADADYEIPYMNGLTPLTAAVMGGHYDIVDELASAGVNLDLCDENGNTALELACEFYDVEMVKMLIGYGANMDYLDDIESSPMKVVIDRPDDGEEDIAQRLEILELLINPPNDYLDNMVNGIDVNLRYGTNDGKTVLMMAAEGGNVEIVTMLLNNGADIDITDDHGKTALTWAEEKGNQEVAELIRAKAQG